MSTSINNLYSGWNIIFGILSVVSLGFIIKYNTQPINSMSCNVQLVDFSYSLYQLLIAILITRILFSVINIIVCANTYKKYNSIERKIFYTFLTIFYGLCILFSIIMIIKFKNNTSCYNFYKINNQYFYKSFIFLCKRCKVS